MSDEEDLYASNIFDEPEGFYQERGESHFVEYDRLGPNAEPKTVRLKLVDKSPLWGHLLWNAGRYTANYLDEKAGKLVKGKRVLELGAASGLPSIICSINDASRVVCTDYPDPDLISHIQHNVDSCDALKSRSNTKVYGYIWGNDVRPLCFDDQEEDAFPDTIGEEKKFDLVILSDLVFNHTEHGKLLQTCRDTLKADGVALVVFSPHRPWLLDADLKFFETCEEYELKAKKVEQVNWKPMFEEDEETAEIRSRVYCYELHPQWR